MWTVLAKLLLALVGKLLWALGGLLWDWVMLARRVRKILTNDLPHAAADRQEIRALVAKQGKIQHQHGELLHEHLGFCRGRTSGKCAPDESPPHPVNPFAPD